ncbi:LacI family DNA-binding transcriptional regulator [Rhodococcus koreensis]|uniref:LacI family DNA-binding transcriptional regulator n=1 Tax=Rhodococcus koreensis TaxID=99653 RepID=UPI0036728C6C
MNSPRITIVDVARAAGTSVTSASVALRGKPGVSDGTRAHIAAVAAKLGYRPDAAARRLRQDRSHLLGVTFALDQAFHTDLVAHLYDAAAEVDHDLVLSAVTENRSASRAAESLLEDRCAALLLISPQITEEELAVLADRSDTVVALGAQVAVPGVDSVRTDDRVGVTLVVDHLVGLGHRAIAYVDASPMPLNAERRDGYASAMRGHGLDRQVRVLPAANTEEAGAALALRLLDEGDLPTALVAYNDMVAIGLILTLRGRGVSVPKDISIVGYDDTRAAGLASVDLSSVRQDGAQLARTAVRWATTVGHDLPGTQQKALVAPQLILRSSTTGPRAGKRVGSG